MNWIFGEHNWSVSCRDAQGNQRESLQFSLDILFKDIATNSSYITLSNYAPVEGDIIELNVTLFNYGDQDIEENFLVNITDVVLGQHTEIDSFFVSGLNASKNITLSMNFTITQGNHTIEVISDQTDLVTEINETNNNANLTLFVEAYQVFYGNITLEILLANSDNLSITGWFNQSTYEGNLFVVDSDSSINWVNITALGRNVQGETALDDFEELDVGLRLNKSTDSINATYTFNDDVVQLKEFVCVWS